MYRLYVTVNYRKSKFYFAASHKVVECETREEAEASAEEIAQVVCTSGFLDDDDPRRWLYVTPTAITEVEFTFEGPEDLVANTDG